ncbi:MAG: DUF2892 domain-containing protein [Verrucomicrobiae bacterium]|nr:DUF2892 domain-containing protein [Verrucomicrobiae bacterium]
MKTESAIRMLAGSMVLLSVALGYFVSEWWLLLAVFVGLNLIQSAFTGFCPAENILAKLGSRDSRSCCCTDEKTGDARVQGTTSN